MTTSSRHSQLHQPRRKGATTRQQTLTLTEEPVSTTSVEIALPQEDVQSKPAKALTLYQRLKFRLRLWPRQRPVVGSLLVVFAGVLVLWGPLALIQFAFLPGSTIWAGILVGALLCVLGLMQLCCPFYAPMTGTLAIVCSLVSLMAATGGFGIGMILGIIGGAQGVAWRSTTISRADYQRLLEAQSHKPPKVRWWQRRKRFASSHK